MKRAIGNIHPTLQNHDSMRTCRRLTLSVFIVGTFLSALDAQPDRISSRIDAGRTVVLAGHIPSRARPEFDQGPVAASFPMQSLTMTLKPSANQQSSLEQLLAGQQNPAADNFHQWLTPEQYADQYGASQNDVNRITAWLQSQGLQVQRVARSRTWIEFSGTAQQVGSAFHTQIHQYLENGELHYANSTDPSIPTALSGMVLGFHGLNNFRLKPHIRPRQSPSATTGTGEHQIAPDDFATIYDVAPLYKAGIDGSGQKLVVVGQTDINLSDIDKFRTQFNLPAINLTKHLVAGHASPGVSQSDLAEADLDIEWSTAVARNANIIFVYSGNVFDSLTDAVDNNYAPVISMSYGLCEAGDFIDLPTERQLAQQANSQGITWLAAAGDNGAADCEGLASSNPTIAQTGLSVDAPGSVPEVTSMGGTEFHEGIGSYWSSSNTANGASALSYIPERVWNDSILVGGLAAGGGGVSSFFPKPVWQTGPGVPNDGFRHVPDLSIASSPDHDGYYVSTGGSMQVYGGTSIAAPSMAGIVALLNQYLVSTGAQKQAGVGNINPTLYRMAQSAPTAFHDVTAGNNSVPCVIGSPNCTTGTLGYSAAARYDQSSGLGSPDAYNFVHQWTSSASTQTAVVPSLYQVQTNNFNCSLVNEPCRFPANPVYEVGGSWPFTLVLTEEAGVATSITSLTINNQNFDVSTSFGTTQLAAGGSISGNFTLSGLSAPVNVNFVLTGTDARGNQWSQQFAAPFAAGDPALVVGGASNAATGKQSYAPGMLLSVYGTAMGSFAQSAGTVPLPQFLAGFEATVNGVNVPLYYVSPGQVNLQIPYETQTGSATLTVGNPYINVDFRLNIVAAAPGIFMTNGFTAAPFSSAARGQTTTLFITGEGQVTPTLATGTSPDPTTPTSQLPKPTLPVTLTVGGQNATIAFIGIPSGLVGVTQINYTVPSGVATGVQPVVVTVGGVASPPANLTVTQ